MDDLKNRIIDEIIHFLVPLKTLYNDEIDLITTDLLNNNWKSLDDFINKYYQDVFYSKELIDLVNELVKNNVIDKHYLISLDKKDEVTFLTIDSSLIRLKDSKPLNVKRKDLEAIRIKISPKKEVILPISTKETNHHDNLSFNDSKSDDKLANDEILSIQESENEKLKKSIIEAQLNYLKNANTFIHDLDTKTDLEIYETLLNLNDIRYIHHCISNLTTKTLNRFLIFMKKQLIENNNNSIDVFITEAIKLHLRNERVTK